MLCVLRWLLRNILRLAWQFKLGVFLTHLGACSHLLEPLLLVFVLFPQVVDVGLPLNLTVYDRRRVLSCLWVLHFFLRAVGKERVL